MKKKFLGIVAAVAVVAIAGVNYLQMNQSVELSDLALENVDALASGESTSNTGPGKTYDCPGIGTGDGKMCMSENSNPCTQIPC